jgi:putative transposase
MHVWTAEGSLYLAVVVYLFSRRVGWSMNAAMTAQLVTDALVIAIWRRGEPDARLHHSDRGSQGGFKRWPQRRPSRPIEASGQAPLRAFSNQASCGAGS